MENIPEFPPGKVPTKVAAKVFGIDPDTLRNQMELGIVDIGTVVKSRKKRGVRQYRTTNISPLKLYQQTGYIWRGETDIKNGIGKSSEPTGRREEL